MVLPGRAVAGEPARIAVRALPGGDGADGRLAAELVDAASVPTVRLAAVGDLALKPPALPGAAALEDRARGLELELKFRDAAVSWRELVEDLSATPVVVVSPGQVARAQLALAAAYAEAGEPDLAVLQFREALAFDEAFAPGPEYAPRLRRLFERARALGPALPPTPDDAVLDTVAAEAGAEGVLWVAVGREGGQRFLVRRLHLVGGDGSEEVRTLLPEEDAEARQVVAREAVTLRGLLATRFPEPAPPAPPRAPWYRSGWVLGGAAGVAVLVAGGLVAGQLLGHDRASVVVQH